MAQRYVMIGAGGTASYLINPVLRYLTSRHKGTDPDVWQFGVIDGDQIEEHNLERQQFDPQTVADNKARALVAQFPHMPNLLAIPEYVGPMNIMQFINDGAVVFLCVDNFKVRKLVQAYTQTLQNATIINGGNEKHTGSCQLFVRRNGENLTPPIDFLHPEMDIDDGDRSEMSCEEIAALPGGEQLLVTNMASAMWMLAGLIKLNTELTWTELQFDVLTGEHDTMDYREMRGWRAEDMEDDDVPSPELIAALNGYPEVGIPL